MRKPRLTNDAVSSLPQEVETRLSAVVLVDEEQQRSAPALAVVHNPDAGDRVPSCRSRRSALANHGSGSNTASMVRPKISSNDEGEREARVEPARLDRIDGLPRDSRCICQLCLRPIPFGPEHTNPVLHPPNRRIPMSTDAM